MSSFGRMIVDRLAAIQRRLRSGEPVECVGIRLESTPDGPLTTVTPFVIGATCPDCCELQILCRCQAADTMLHLAVQVVAIVQLP